MSRFMLEKILMCLRTGHVVWQSLLRLLSWYCHVIKSRQLSWRPGSGGSSDELQLLNLKMGHQDNSSNNGHQADIPVIKIDWVTPVWCDFMYSVPFHRNCNDFCFSRINHLCLTLGIQDKVNINLGNVWMTFQWIWLDPRSQLWHWL